MEDVTRKFTALDSKAEMREILSSVYNSLRRAADDGLLLRAAHEYAFYERLSAYRGAEVAVFIICHAFSLVTDR